MEEEEDILDRRIWNGETSEAKIMCLGWHQFHNANVIVIFPSLRKKQTWR
jgi:hypothetical protein